MTTAYTNFIQTSVANTYINYEGNALGNVNTLTFAGSDLTVVNIGTEVVVALYPTVFGTQPYISAAFSNAAPVNITGNYNIPVYLDGTDVGANYFYPFYQNTSSTANGYVANSTASFLPTNAAFISVTNGQDGWYRYVDSTKTTTWTGNIGVGIKCGTQFVANANTTIQFIPYIRDNVNPNNWFASTELMNTVELIANRPVGINFEASYFPVNANVVQGAGVIIRNCVANTRVNIPQCVMRTDYYPQ